MYNYGATPLSFEKRVKQEPIPLDQFGPRGGDGTGLSTGRARPASTIVHAHAASRKAVTKPVHAHSVVTLCYSCKAPVL